MHKKKEIVDPEPKEAPKERVYTAISIRNDLIDELNRIREERSKKFMSPISLSGIVREFCCKIIDRGEANDQFSKSGGKNGNDA